MGRTGAKRADLHRTTEPDAGRALLVDGRAFESVGFGAILPREIREGSEGMDGTANGRAAKGGEVE